MAQRQQARHRGLYDWKCRGAVLSVGDLVLVKQTAWRGRHKIQDRWESGEYQVVGQPTPGVPVYTVKSLSGGRTKVLHRNLLLPLQGRTRQEGEVVEGESTDSEEEERERAVRPQAARAPKGNPTKPPGSPSPAEHSASSVTDHSPPESSSGEEDSIEEGEITYNTGSLTSHTTASSSTSADMLSAEASNRTPHKSDSITESQFSSVIPYTEDTGQTSDSVFVVETSTDPHVSQHISHTPSQINTSNASSSVEATPTQTPAPRRSTRSTKGIPPVRYGNVITHCTRVTNMTNTSAYRQTLFVSCMPNIILG